MVLIYRMAIRRAHELIRGPLNLAGRFSVAARKATLALRVSRPSWSGSQTIRPALPAADIPGRRLAFAGKKGFPFLYSVTL